MTAEDQLAAEKGALALTVAYDGSLFAGFARQPGQRTGQCGIIRTLAERTANDEHIELIGHIFLLQKFD